MAELVAGPFVSFVVQRLGDLLVQEGKFLGGVRGQVEQMQTELNRMQCFLKDADAKREGDERVRNWVAEIREVAYDAEDVIETFVVKVAFRRRAGILNVLMRYSCVVKDCITLCKIGLEIQSIKTKVSDITSSLQTYGVTATRGEEGSSSTHERQRQARQSYPHSMEDDIVGLDEDLKTIVEYLVKEERQCRVVCIWGMGGLGKTTLAKMVYNHMEVRRHFDCFAWAYISQQCNTREVLEGILIKLTSASQKMGEIKEMTHDKLVEELHQIQIEKKCLVILDDIWKPEDWDSLSPAFPKTDGDSKILLTTRIREVASSVDQQCFIHELRTLTEAESWELFEKKAFSRRNDTEFRVNRETMELGNKMVKHCGGLPLAIVVLGGLLGTKDSLYDWETVYRNLGYHLSKGKGHERVKDVLALSYQDLPYHLKACFLYLSHLPEDYGIHRQDLVQKWMAEGIVPTRVGEEETMLDVGMSYLDELVQRCMVQVQLTTYSRRVKFCRLHDLMRDLCLLKAQEENFFKVIRLQAFEDHHYQFMSADNSASSSSSLTKIRRLAVYYSGDREIDSTRRGIIDEIRNHHHHIRSCQFYCYGYSLESSGWREVELLFMSFKLLRNLDLEGIVVNADNKILLPKAIGDLIHLRYLSIKGSHITELPSSIGNLGFLQTLDLRVCSYIAITIPNVLWKLKQLRHLYFKGVQPAASVGYNLRLDGLSKLEILEGFTPLSFDARCFHKLPNLRRIKVEVFPENLAVILKSPVLSNSNRLLRYSSFFIRGNFRTEEEQSFLRQLLGCHHLQKLHLEGSLNLVKLPDQLPPNLTMLSLRGCNLVEDPMPALGNLPNLRWLTICMESYLGKEMVCPAPKPASGGGCNGGFPQLKYLCLESFPNLEEWRVEKGAMPSLLHLEIKTCPKLKEIPDGLRFITPLRELMIKGISEALQRRLRGGGEDFHKVQHVPSIIIEPIIWLRLALAASLHPHPHP